MSQTIQLEKLQAKFQKEMQERIETIRTKYPHVKAETLYWDEASKKYAAICVCTKCGKEHVRFSSDFHQATLCQDCRKSAQKEAKRVVAEQLKAALAQIRNTAPKA